MIVSVNGAAETSVPITDRGFLFGEGAFETLRTYGQRPFAEEDHLERLRASLEAMRIPLDSEALLGESRALVARFIANHPGDEAVVRWIVTGGDGLGLAAPTHRAPRRVCVVAPLPSPAEASIAVWSVPTARSRETGAPGKRLSYVESVMAAMTARDHGASEALMVQGDAVFEGASSNVFVARGGALFTPALSEPILAGITRKVTLTLAANLGLEVRERPLIREDLLTADEVFVTSTLRQIMPVRSVDGRPIALGPLAARLRESFDRWVAQR